MKATRRRQVKREKVAFLMGSLTALLGEVKRDVVDLRKRVEVMKRKAEAEGDR